MAEPTAAIIKLVRDDQFSLERDFVPLSPNGIRIWDDVPLLEFRT